MRTGKAEYPEDIAHSLAAEHMAQHGRQLPVPPQELPRRARSVYFQIDRHSEQWAQVEKGYNLSLYWDSAPDDLKTELMVVGRT